MKQIVFSSLFLLIFSTVKSQNFKYTRSPVDITNNSDFTTFQLMDSAIQNYHVFFSGENHQFKASNARLELKLLKYLHEKAGVNHLLLEFSFTTGYLLEKYMFENDTQAYAMLKVNYHNQYMWMFEHLKEYNATLDSAHKIRVHGIDFEDDMQLAVRTLVMLMPDKEAPDSIGLHIETLRGMNGRYARNTEYNEYEAAELGTGIFGYNYRAGRTISDLLDNYDRQKLMYDAYFGKNATLVSTIMWHMKENLQWREYYTGGNMQERPFRERYMYNNFLKLVEQNPEGKFFGQFGRCHTSLNQTDENCDVTFFNSLAGKINNSPNPYLKGKVFIAAGFYPHAEMNATSTISKAGFASFLNKMEKQAYDTSITLFLVEKDSVHYGDLYKHYNFIFFNNNSLANDRALKVEKGRKKHKGFFGRSLDKDMFTGISGEYQLAGVKTAALKPFFNTFGLTPPVSPIVMNGLSFVVFNDYSGNYSSFHYGKMAGLKYTLSDTTGFSFNYSSVSFKYGSDLFPHNPLLNVIPCLGLTYSQYHISYTNSKSPSLFQSEKTGGDISYKNPAMLADVSLRVSTHFYMLGLSAWGGYQFDVSGQKWRRDGSYSTIAPKTSLGGWYAGAGVGLFINR